VWDASLAENAVNLFFRSSIASVVKQVAFTGTLDAAIGVVAHEEDEEVMEFSPCFGFFPDSL
jgi:hypothetical protein